MLVLAFIIGHWAADLGWLTLVSAGIHRGKFILGEKEYRAILAACGVFLVCFGGYYIITFWNSSGKYVHRKIIFRFHHHP